MSELPQFLTVTQVAAVLQIHRRTVLHLINDGRIEAFRVGKNWRVPRGTLENLSKAKRGNGVQSVDGQ